MPAKYVIHTVGPVWQSGICDEAQQLESCYQRSMELARTIKVKSIAFPAISCGRYGYPYDQAARIAISTVVRMFKSSGLELVIFAVIEKAIYEAYESAVFDFEKSGDNEEKDLPF